MGFDINIVKQGGKYWSCRDLQWGVFLHDTWIGSCGDCDNRDRTSPYSDILPIAVKSVDDIKFDKEFFDKVTETKLEFIRKINDNEGCVCTGCKSLLLREWDPMPKMKINRFYVWHGHSCNASCYYCDQNHNAPLRYKISDLFDGGIEHGYISLSDIYYISWFGGEPTLLPDYEEVQKKIPNATFVNATFTTAIKFSEELAKLLETTTNAKVHLSIDSGNRETYKKIKGVDQFNRVVENFDKYYQRAKVKSNVTLKYIMLPENYSYEELDSFLNLIESKKWYGITVAVDFNFLKNRKPDENILQAIGYLSMKAPLITGGAVVQGGVQIPELKYFDIDKMTKFGKIEYFARENGLSLDEVVELVKNNKK